jgi:hypothetical protein
MTVTHSPERAMGAAARRLIEGPTCYIDGGWETGAGDQVLTSVNPTTTATIRGRPGRAGGARRAAGVRRRTLAQGDAT